MLFTRIVNDNQTTLMSGLFLVLSTILFMSIGEINNERIIVMSAVSVIYALYNHWTKMILSGKKPIEFRTKLPKELKVGTKIYLYETKRNGGQGAVVGECIVKDIIDVQRDDGAWPLIGCYPFMEYYLRNVLKDNALADKVVSLQNEFRYAKNYKYGFVMRYVFSEDQLNSLRSTGRLLDIMEYNPWKEDEAEILHRIFKDKQKGDQLEHDCDSWMKKIGFYNENDESNYKYGIVLSDPVKYDTPVKICDFLGTNGANIKTPPQSFCYTIGKI